MNAPDRGLPKRRVPYLHRFEKRFWRRRSGLAANVVATLPMVLLFVVAGRYIMQGIAITGEKE